MGKLITFWSPYPGQGRVTSTMCAVAGAMGMEYPELDMALSHTKPDSTELEDRLEYRLTGEEQKELHEKSGLSSLSLNFMQAALTSEKIRHCAIPLLMRSLYLFPGAGKKEISDALLFQLITEHLTEDFSAVFLDLGSGRADLSFSLMKAADIVVVMLPQYPPCWERFLREEEAFLGGKEFWIMLGGYLDGTKYGMRYFSRLREGKGKLIGEIPMNAGYLDAMSEGRTLEFFLKNQWAGKKEENYEFIIQAKKAAECFKKKLFIS